MLPELSLYWPTASQNVVVRQDTPLRLALVEPGGPGIVCALQADPFHISPPAEPTVSQKLTDTHDTAPTPAVPGRDCICHEVPFQRSANEPA